MPTKRCWTTCFSNGTVLIVAGGCGVSQEEKALSTVALQWSAVDSLPIGVKTASALLCNNQLYILGGKDKDGKSSMAAYSCSLATLLRLICPINSEDSAESSTAGACGGYNTAWTPVAAPPLADCAFVSVTGKLLAIGGRSQSESEGGSYSSAVNLYLPHSFSWEVVSAIETGRSSCFAAALPGHQLMIAGGMVAGDLCTTTVKFATVE